MQIKLIYKISAVLAILLLATSTTSAQVEVSWGVGQGDTVVYWIDDIQSSIAPGSNLAETLFVDDNRTQYLTVTDVGDTYLNYTLALLNTTLVPDQQISVTQTNLEGIVIELPNGSLPLILPLATETRSNYLSYLASSVNAANGFIGNILEGQNLSDISEASVSAVYLSDYLNITASARVSNLSSLTAGLMDEVNITDQISLNENQTIEDIWVDLLLSYSTDDGTLLEIDLDTALNATQVVEVDGQNSTVSNLLTFNATIIQQEFISAGNLASRASDAADTSFLIIGVIPALYVLKRRKFND